MHRFNTLYSNIHYSLLINKIGQDGRGEAQHLPQFLALLTPTSTSTTTSTSRLDQILLQQKQINLPTTPAKEPLHSSNTKSKTDLLSLFSHPQPHPPIPISLSPIPFPATALPSNHISPTPSNPSKWYNGSNLALPWNKRYLFTAHGNHVPP